MAKYSQTKQFKFTGYVTFKKENLLKDKIGSTWRKLSFGVTDENGNNTQYVSISEFNAGKSFKVKSPTENGTYEDLEIEWNERNKKEVIEDVANFNKKYVLGSIRLHAHDVIDDVLKAVEDEKLFPAKFEEGKVVKGVKVTVSGTIKINYFNNSFNQEFEFSRLSIVKDDTPCEFSGSMSLVFNKDAVKERKDKFVVNGYCYDYIKLPGKERGEMKLLPQVLVVQKKGLGQKIGEYLVENMKTKKDEFKAIRFDVSFIRGAEEVEPENIKLTPEQEMLVEMGLLSAEDVIDKAISKKINEVRIEKLYAKGEYRKVVIPTAFKQKDIFIDDEDDEDVYEDSIFNTSDDDDDIDELPFNIDDLPF